MKPIFPARKPRILIVPLDWGLGHAARCLPIIRLLLQKGCAVVLAGEGKVAHFLRTEFPQLPLLPLPGYNIQYTKKGSALPFKLLQQLPRLRQAIRAENAWLQTAVKEHGIDAVISDNRYGLHHAQVPSVLITHQLEIQTPLGSFGNTLLQKLHYSYFNRFTACWVPDYAGTPNLAGKLSHPKKMPAVPVTYIGPLSRFAPPADTLQHFILLLLSGPEPQRTLLEEKWLQQLPHYRQAVLLVRGLPGQVGLPKVPYHVNVVNHLPTPLMQLAMEQASMVVSRSGYSTVMDLMALGKKSILVPTPGQTEQQYLARHLMAQNWALHVPQQKFNLSTAIDLAQHFTYKTPVFTNDNTLDAAIDQLILSVQNAPSNPQKEK